MWVVRQRLGLIDLWLHSFLAFVPLQRPFVPLQRPFVPFWCWIAAPHPLCTVWSNEGPCTRGRNRCYPSTNYRRPLCNFIGTFPPPLSARATPSVLAVKSFGSVRGPALGSHVLRHCPQYHLALRATFVPFVQLQCPLCNFTHVVLKIEKSSI